MQVSPCAIFITVATIIMLGIPLLIALSSLLDTSLFQSIGRWIGSITKLPKLIKGFASLPLTARLSLVTAAVACLLALGITAKRASHFTVTIVSCHGQKTAIEEQPPRAMLCLLTDSIIKN